MAKKKSEKPEENSPESMIDPKPVPEPEKPKRKVVGILLDELAGQIEKTGWDEAVKNRIKVYLSLLRKNEDRLEKLGADKIKELLDLVKEKKEDEARKKFITDLAGPDDLIAGMEESAKEIAEARLWSDVFPGLTGAVAGLLLALWNLASKKSV